MRPKAEWAIDSEPIPARGIIVTTLGDIAFVTAPELNVENSALSVFLITIKSFMWKLGVRYRCHKLILVI